MRRFLTHTLSPVEFLILLSLKEEKKHGYGVIKDLREHFGDSWEVKSGTVYPALRRLESRGFVSTSFDEPEQKEYYAITEEGRHEIEESIASFAEELGFSSRYYDFISHRVPRMGWKFKDGLDKEPPEFDPLGVMFEMFSDALPHEAKIEWLQKWEKTLEAKLEKIRKMLLEEKKGLRDNR